MLLLLPKSKARPNQQCCFPPSHFSFPSSSIATATVVCTGAEKPQKGEVVQLLQFTPMVTWLWLLSQCLLLLHMLCQYHHLGSCPFFLQFCDQKIQSKLPHIYMEKEFLFVGNSGGCIWKVTGNPPDKTDIGSADTSGESGNASRLVMLEENMVAHYHGFISNKTRKEKGIPTSVVAAVLP